jgi:L-rhamnono-1,4-lactonase
MFGSDWPVCNVGGPGAELAWRYWRDLVEDILSARNLSDDEKTMVWSHTARSAYDIP